MEIQIPEGAVVVGVDGSEHSGRALAWGALEAAAEQRPLVLVHGAGDGALLRQSPWSTIEITERQRLQASLLHAAQALVDQAADGVRREHPDVEVTTCVVEDDPREVLVAASHSAGIVVLGSRGRGPMLSMLGSVSAYAAKHAVCPVAVCRPAATTSGGGGVLVGVDGTAADRPTLVAAFGLASRRQLALTVMHCLWEAGTQPPGPDAVEELRLLAGEAVAGLQEDFPDVQVTLETSRGLLDAVFADKSDAMDVVVVGRPHVANVPRIIYGYTAIAVLERSHTTVVVVPAPPIDRGGEA